MRFDKRNSKLQGRSQENKNDRERSSGRKDVRGKSDVYKKPFKRDGQTEDKTRTRRTDTSPTGFKKTFKHEGRTEDRPRIKRSDSAPREFKKDFRREGQNDSFPGDFKKDFKREGKPADRSRNRRADSSPLGYKKTFKRDGQPDDRTGTTRRTDSSPLKRRSFQPAEKRTFRTGTGPSEGNTEKRHSSGERAGKPSYTRDHENTPERKSFTGRRNVSRKSTPARSKSTSNEIRLNRFIAQSGICSRREADDYIKAGLVSVNGKVVTEMGVKIKPADLVRYNGETVRSERLVYIVLNKPKDYVTSLDDEQGRKTVIDLIGNACPERVYPVGRLDRNTTGVMLLTNDGELTGKLTHPKYKKKKVYHVFLDKNLKKDDMNSIVNGVNLEDGPFAPDSISYIDPVKKSEVGLEIHSGRNRIVRRLFEYFGYNVIKLDRVYFAGLTKKNLPRGKWRFLTDKEVNILKMNAYE